MCCTFRLLTLVIISQKLENNFYFSWFEKILKSFKLHPINRYLIIPQARVVHHQQKLKTIKLLLQIHKNRSNSLMVLLSYQGNKFVCFSINLHFNWGKSGVNYISRNLLALVLMGLSRFLINDICHKLCEICHWQFKFKYGMIRLMK